MAKKRGRPSKQTPSSSTPSHARTNESHKVPISLDFSLLDDQILNFKGLESLDGKQAETLLANIEALREKIKSKEPNSPEHEVVKETQLVNESSPSNNDGTRTISRAEPEKEAVHENLAAANIQIVIAANGDSETNKGPAVNDANSNDKGNLKGDKDQEQWQMVLTRQKARGNRPKNMAMPENG
ncbi:hypothetical protein RIF29_19642 [Crotalaria pallida]|uniref:Uncharacterized protein n=1 Tax=Crotalaria pallida TaxID=3830 RepID=A0AAN9I7W9_CROPI